MSGSSHNCQSPLQYYTCNSNGFKGCCAIDPCNLSSGCPQSDGIQPTVTTSISNAAASISSEPTSTLSPAGHSDTITSSIKSILADPNLTTSPSSTTSSDPYAAATLLVPNPSAATTSTDPASTVLITSLIFVSLEIVTPTSNGVALAPTSWLVTSTALSSISAPIAAFSAHPSSASPSAASPSITPIPNSPTHYHSTTPVVAGSVGGVAGVVVAAFLIWLLIRWQRSTRAKGMREAQLDDDPRLQGIDANRAGSALKGDEDLHGKGMEACTAGTDRMPVSPLSSINRTSRATTATRLSPPYEHRSPEEEGLMSGSSNDYSELSGHPAPSISELSPNAERSAINSPKRAAVPASSHMEVEQLQGTGTLMHPNLNSTKLSPTRGASEADHKEHIMSWMDYDGRNPGPAR